MMHASQAVFPLVFFHLSSCYVSRQYIIEFGHREYEDDEFSLWIQNRAFVYVLEHQKNTGTPRYSC